MTGKPRKRKRRLPADPPLDVKIRAIMATEGMGVDDLRAYCAERGYRPEELRRWCQEVSAIIKRGPRVGG